DLAADRRLRHVQPRARGSEGTSFRDGADDFQLSEIHARLWGGNSYKGNKKNRFILSILVMGLADGEMPLHFLTLSVLRQVAVEGEGARLVRPELERHRLPGAGALRDPVGAVDGQAVRDVARRAVDLHQVVA